MLEEFWVSILTWPSHAAQALSSDPTVRPTPKVIAIAHFMNMPVPPKTLVPSANPPTISTAIEGIYSRDHSVVRITNADCLP
jgi:hypothetical protein